MEQKNLVRGDEDTATRRKSLGRLKDMSVAFDVDPQIIKYSRNDDTESSCPSSRVLSDQPWLSNDQPKSPGDQPRSFGDQPRLSLVPDGLVDVELTRKQPNMSAMEMESIKERERASMLRKCAQHLELESVNGKYTRENFKRGILNKVRPINLIITKITDKSKISN